MNRARTQSLLGHILNTPLLTWVLLGFAISYLLFFIYPTFFSSKLMRFSVYVPVMDPIGNDLKYTLNFTDSWFAAKQNLYINGRSQCPYPPLTCLLFMPLILVNWSLAYKIVTIVTIFCYVMIALVFPLWTGKERQVLSLPMLVFVTGLFSYGFQFELERGQFNLIAVFTCFLSIWIYHYRHRYRYLAYSLFTISVQLKVYPLIFIVMLISDWRDWKHNIKRILLLAAMNLASLFILGPRFLVAFIDTIKHHAEDPCIWMVDHSVRCFVPWVSKIAAEHGLVWINEYLGLVQSALLAIVAGCIFLILLQAYRQRHQGVNPLLLLACTIGSLLIPPTSQDYTLSFLAAPVAILFSNTSFWEGVQNPRLRIIFIVLMFIFSAAYSSTLFSFTNKPLVLQNNCPALVAMLLVITFLSIASKPSLEGNVPEPIETA